MLLPQSVEYEKSVICSIMFDQTGREIMEAQAILKPSDFSDYQCGLLYEACCALTADGKPLDSYSLGQWIQIHHGIENQNKAPIAMVWASEILERTEIALNMRHYCGLIKNTSILRAYCQTAQSIISLCCSPGTEPVNVKEAVDAGFTLTEISEAQNIFNVGNVSKAVLQQAFDQARAKRGIQTPWRALNYLTQGLQPSNLVILAARPGLGKTALAINLIDFVACRNQPVAFFSLEMSAEEIIRRAIAGKTGISSSRILDGDLSDGQKSTLQDAGDYLTDVPLYIDDRGGITISEIKAATKRIKAKHGLALVVVDYIQLIKGPKSERRDLEIGAISKGLKELAKELDIPVLALAQINRSNEKENRKPRISDLRESGSLEQDADIVMFLHSEPMEEKPPVFPVNLIISKHRNGPQGLVKLVFRGETTTFTEEARQ